MAQRPLFDPSRARGAKKSEAVLGGGPTTLRVRQVNDLIRAAVEAQVPATLHVLGEIGDFSRAASGHIYFTLKDSDAELRCVMWRSAAIKLKFEPKAGMEIIATGGIEVYSPRGTYQLVVARIEPRGVGALELAFRQLRDKLEAEGLLDPARKRPLPPVPQRIGLVTSESGAAIRDILTTLARRFPKLEVLVFSVRVQGEGAAGEIAAAIRLMNLHAERLGGIQAAIVGRGGGSLEDLWAFNEEVVARAIVASAIPIISAVGHEIDVSISDLVADVRAATPTAAAELIAPNLSDLVDCIERCAHHARRAVRNRLALALAQYRELTARPPLRKPTARIHTQRQRADELQQRMRLASALAFRAVRDRLNRLDIALWKSRSRASFARLAERITRHVQRITDRLALRLRGAERRLHIAHARLHSTAPRMQSRCQEQRLEHLRVRLRGSLRRLIDARSQQLNVQIDALRAADPRSVLRRGYSITRDARGQIIRSAQSIRDGAVIDTETADGRFRSIAEDPRQPRLFP